MVEEGTHRALLEGGGRGKYEELWKMQLQHHAMKEEGDEEEEERRRKRMAAFDKRTGGW